MQSKGASSSLPSSEIPEKITVITSITPSALLSHDLVIDDEDRGASITGRWTAQEHHLFLRGLKRYGRAWSKIAKTIPNRTTTQVRTHAQKYFIKLERARSAPTTTCGPLYPAPNVGSINQHVLIPANSTQGFQTSNSTVKIDIIYLIVTISQFLIVLLYTCIIITNTPGLDDPVLSPAIDCNSILAIPSER
jgi:SHAQKYF class myb-like DNA-binding protein